MTDDNEEEFIKDFERQLDWFCERIMEPIPHHTENKEHIYRRMAQVGWVRQSEVDTYKLLTRSDDD
jgi:hypothetical protein